jgi:holo-[acyl-carrier protein] synthase
MIGIDITSVNRIKRMYEKFGERAYTKFLNPKEIELIKKPETAAGFWAAKEAASKAIGTGIGASCGFHDIKISKSELGAPQIKYKKRVRKAFNIKNSHLSITHDAGFVIAVVVNTLK